VFFDLFCLQISIIEKVEVTLCFFICFSLQISIMQQYIVNLVSVFTCFLPFFSFFFEWAAWTYAVLFCLVVGVSHPNFGR